MNLLLSEGLEQYRELTRLAYRVLRLCPRLPVLALSMVHPRHPVPAEQLELMVELQEGGNGEKFSRSQSAHRLGILSLALMARKCIPCLLYMLRQTVRLMRLRWQVRPLLNRAKCEPADVVMKTWGFGPHSLSNPTDFYYGRLPQLLKQRGISSVLLCGDARGDGPLAAFEQSALSQTHVRYVPEKVLVPLWAPFLAACSQVFTSFSLWRLGRKVNKDWKFATICERACLDCLNPSTTSILLYYYLAAAAVKTLNAKVFVTLYEGQPWEKAAWQGATAAKTGCLTVGYQHTVIMPHSLSLTFPNQGSWEMSAPEVVLCLGQVTRNMMKPGHEAHRTKLIQFGSFRWNSGDPLPLAPRPKQQTVLVVPETGVIREAQLLFNFAMRAARLIPEHRFIFRCHPVMPFERILPHLENTPKEFPNIEISDRDVISDDFARSSVVLYRGSSSVLYAVLYGLKPVYLHDGCFPGVDPLFELGNWREHVSLPGDLVERLQHYASTPEVIAAEDWRSAVEYVHAYTTPIDSSSVDRFLESVGLTRGTTVG